MQTITWQNLTEQQKKNALMRPAVMNSTEISNSVEVIVNEVRKNGDTALRVLTEKFDKTEIDTLLLSEAEIENACARVSDSIKASVQLAITNIQKFHQAQQMPSVSVETMPGILCQQLVRPIQAVGLYIPGGTAPLLSTVMMLAIPAKIAGCEQIVLCSPPPIADEIIYTAKACGVDQIFQVGGAQAVAAMAFGTESIPKVDKIFGPGNAYVTEAKKQVSLINGGAAMDMPAGPSEVLVIADKSANPGFIAADLLSQAEHDTLACSILVTPSNEVANSVAREVEKQLEKLSRNEIARKSIENYGRIIVTENMNEAIDLANEIAPGHLELAVENPFDYLSRIKNAGAIFLGEYSPEPLGDYFAGPNHTLPTSGTAKFASPLSVDAFIKKSSVIYYTREALAKVKDSIIRIAESETLTAHANSVRVRFEDDKNE